MAPKARLAKRAYHHGNLREALVEGALQLAKTEGARGVTLAAAAKKAGVSVAAPYRHFADHQALLAAAATRAFVAFREALVTARATAPKEPLQALLAMGQAYVSYRAEHPEHMDLMFSCGLDAGAYPEMRTAGDAAFAELIGAVAELAKAGQLQADQVESTGIQLWFLVHGAAMVGDSGPEPIDARRLVREGTLALLEGKRAPTKKPAAKGRAKP